MKKLILALLLIITTCIASAGAAPMILEYDGSVRNYSGNIYDLEVNGLLQLPILIFQSSLHIDGRWSR